MKIPINIDELLAAVERSMFGDESVGFCIGCGAEQAGCEPDAERYPCESCGERKVYGAEQLLWHCHDCGMDQSEEES